MNNPLLPTILGLNSSIIALQQTIFSFIGGYPAPAPAAMPAEPAFIKPATAASGLDKPKNKAPQKVHHTFTSGDFTANDLSQAELDKIVAVYGLNIQDIYGLSPGQQWMFSKAQTVTSAFFTQALFKAKTKLDLASFRENVDAVVQKHDNLRTAFVYKGLEKPYQVVLKMRQADMNFRDISDADSAEQDERLKQLMDIERRRGFDLQTDPLLRISILKLGEDIYAILVSQPHINHDGVSAGLFYKELFLDYALNEAGLETQQLPDVQYKKYMEWLSKRDKNSELDYWKNELSGVKKHTPIPGIKPIGLEYRQDASVLIFDEDVTKKLIALQGAYKATLFNVIQVAWGAMLMSLYRNDDIIFGAISSGRPHDDAEANFILGGMVNAIPVRIKANTSDKLKDLAAAVQTQFGFSLKNSFCSPDEICEAIGLDGMLFDHLLNSHLSMGGVDIRKEQSSHGIELTAMQVFDHLSTDLWVYFAMDKGRLAANFVYNGVVLSSTKVKLLQNNFKAVVTAMAENAEITVGDIKTGGIEEFAKTEREESTHKLEMLANIKNFILFRYMEEAALAEILNNARLNTYTSGECCSRHNQFQDMVSILYSGNAEYSHVTSAGWLSTVKILKKGDILAAEALLTDTAAFGEVTAVSENIEVLSFPKDIFEQFIQQYPVMNQNIIFILNEQVKKMTALWLNT